jgi:hypothetical protein
MVEDMEYRIYYFHINECIHNARTEVIMAEFVNE